MDTKNIRRGVFVSGNHMPYDNPEKFTMDELRGILAERFPVESRLRILTRLPIVFQKLSMEYYLSEHACILICE